MGRPKGSKNKSKVTTALIGEVINKPVKETEPELPIRPPRVVEDEDINDAVLAEVVPKGLEPTPKKKLPKGVRDIADKIDFIMEDLQSLRNYMCRFEDAFAAAKKEGILVQSPDLPEELKTKKHRRRKTH